MQNAKLLSLCAIVKNEEEHIQSFLTKVKPFVDEINIVDTGSNDSTIKVIEDNFPLIKIKKITWKNNFAEARNDSLSMATAKWIIVLDADEEIDKMDFPKIRHLLTQTKAEGLVLNQRNYTFSADSIDFQTNKTDYVQGTPYPGYTDVRCLRIFKNKPDYRFQGYVHEIMDYALKNEKKDYLNIPIHHYGWLSKEKKEKKNNFYLNLLKQELKDTPGLFKVKYTLARQYFDIKKHEKALHLFIECIKERPDVSKLYLYTAITLNKLGKYRESIKYLEKADHISPNNHQNHTLLGVAYFHLNRIQKSIFHLKYAIELNPTTINDYNILGYIFYTKKKYKEAIIYFQEAIKRYSDFSQANINLFLCLFDMGRIKESIEQAKKVLKIDKEYTHIINEKLKTL